MNRKKVESEEAMESSSSEDAEDEQPEEEEEEEELDEEKDGKEESASESSSDDDEFDSADDRVNMVPSETPSATLKSFAQVESADDSESEEEEEEEEEPMKLAMKPAESKEIEGIKSFDSDVESEYESESSSESEGLTQKTGVKESSVEAEEALPLTQKKAKKDDILVNQGIAQDDQNKKGKDKALKQQQEPKPAKVNAEAMKGQGGAVKQTLEDNEQSQSVKDEKKGGPSAKKRKLESARRDGETDSADSVPILKRRKTVDAAQNGKEGADKNKQAHTPSDTGKEIARKTLSDPFAKPNGSEDVVNNKVSTVDHEPRQQKKSNTDASKGLASPQKQKKLPHVWSTGEEITMSSEVLNRVKMGLGVPTKRNDDFWLTLSEILHEKLGVEFSREQLSEKLRRMKLRYQSSIQKIKEPHDLHKANKYKNNDEQNLFDIWKQIWGRGEVTTSEDHQVAKKEPSKPLVVAAVKEGINSTKASKIRPASKAKASKENAVENSVGRDALLSEGVTTMPMELDKGEAAKEDHATDGRSSLPNESAVLSKDMHKMMQDKIHVTLNELQEWSKNSMETWMSKALALIEHSVKALGDQARRMNAMGIAGGGLPMTLCDSMEFQFVHGEEAFQQQWYELHLQELNIYSQRLELMQKECKLKQEQLKLQLQLERGK